MIEKNCPVEQKLQEVKQKVSRQAEIAMQRLDTPARELSEEDREIFKHAMGCAKCKVIWEK